MDILGFFQLISMYGVLGSLAAIGYAAWVIIKKLTRFFDASKATNVSIARIEAAITTINHNSDRMERALLAAGILKPEDFKDEP